MPTATRSLEKDAPSLQADAVAIADSGGVVEVGYKPTRWFFGWLMLPLAIVLMVGTSPGQTFGLTFFNSHFREAFQLSQTRLSATYLLATVVAALSLPYIGGRIDRYGLRRSAVAATIMMALTCAFASRIQGIGTLFLAFVLLRAVGPGTMTLVANNTLARWFDRRLGLVIGMMHVTMSVAMAYVPAAILALIETHGWRNAYLVLAVFFAAGVVPLLVLVYRESPATLGQFPDGGLVACPKRKRRAATGLDVKQAMRHRAYWILLAAAATWALIGTGLVFHLEAVCLQHGMGEGAAPRAMRCLAIGMAATQIFGGIVADRVAARWLLCSALSLIAVGLTVLAAGDARHLIGGYTIFGCAQGFMTIIAGTAWPRYFGQKHLGRIRGTSLSAAIAGSSVGPLVMGVSKDYAGGFSPSLWLFAGGAALVAVASLWATPPASSDPIENWPNSNT